MAAGQEVTQTLEASATTKTAGIQAADVGSDLPEVYYSAVTNKKPKLMSAAFRTNVSAADTGVWLNDSPYNESPKLIGNSPHIAVRCEFSVASQSATIFFALYDGNMDHDNYPSLIGVTRDYTITGDAFYRGTGFISPSEIIDVGPATWVYPVVRTIPSSGTVSIFIEAL